MNELLQSGHWRGTFSTREEAEAYCIEQAKRCRSFVTLQVHTGSPKRPGKPIGPKYRGEC